MFHLNTLTRRALAGALCLALQPALAAPGSLEGARGYYQSCINSVDFPRPFGEWDLKGNAKLPQYCECYVPLFTAQNTAARANMEHHGGPATPAMIKENKAAELALRNTCRKQVGLPPVYDPKVKAPGASRAKQATKKTN